MKKPILLVIVFVLIVIIAFVVLRSGKTSESETSESGAAALAKKGKDLKIPLDVSLRYIQGVEGIGPLLIVRLFSRSLLQQDIDNKVLHKGAEKEIKPLVVACPKDFWNEAVTFLTSEREGDKTNGNRIDADIRLVRAPEESQWEFTPGKVYEALYQLPSLSVVPPGNRLWVELTLENQTIRSNDVPSPPGLGDGKDRLIQKAHLLNNLGNHSELLNTAEDMILSFPNDSSGYWFKGMALERSGDEASALVAYEEALKNYPPVGQEGNVEPPLLLIDKIKQLKQRR